MKKRYTKIQTQELRRLGEIADSWKYRGTVEYDAAIRKYNEYWDSLQNLNDAMSPISSPDSNGGEAYEQD